MLKGRCQIWHPDRTHAVLPLRPLPESSERFHLQTPNTDTGWDDQDRRMLFNPRHDFFSLDAGALIPLCVSHWGGMLAGGIALASLYKSAEDLNIPHPP